MKIRKKRTNVKNGDKFNRLTVVSFVGIDRNRHKTFKVLCECGNYHITKGTHLIQGTVRSCGCLFFEVHSKDKGEAGFRFLYRRCRRNATYNRNYEFKLTYEEFKNIIIQNCYYCDQIPTAFNPYLKRDGSLKDNRKNKISSKSIERAWVFINGIDRKINEIGYILENSVPCCPQCNQSKMDFTEEEFINHSKRIVEFQKGKING